MGQPESLEKKPKSKMPLYLIGGCVVLLLLCCIGSVLFLVVGKNYVDTFVSGLSTSLGSEPVETPTSALVQPPLPLPGQRTPVAQPTQPSSNPPGSSSGNPFGDALGKAKNAQKYRIETTMLIGSTTNGKYAEEALFDFKGMVDGKNSQFESKGGVMAMLGSGTVEIVSADGKTYMRGVTMFGVADPKTWYVMKDSSSGGGFESFAKPDSFDSFMGDTKATDLKKVGNESVDGQACDIYSYDYKNAKNAAITGLLGSAKDKEDFSAIDKYEVRAWLCGDGYVHKFVLDMQTHNAKDPNEKGGFKMNAHMWDFNNATIKVTAPPNAKPFPGQ